MVPVINPRGSSFKGLTSYLLYGKDRTETPERVEWSQTGNMYTNDPEQAAKVMAFTAMYADDIKRESGGSLAGTKAEGKSVYHNSLSWRTGDEPSQEHMKQTALDYLEYRGLSEHEYYIIAHNDTDHKHMHIVANLVHPETGKTKELGKDKEAARDWAREYERQHGIQCDLREENAEKRERGEYTNEKHKNSKSQKQDYTTEITRAYYAADDGRSFTHALDAEGLTLARGRRNNFVVVDKNGDIQNLSQQLDIEARGKQKTAAIQNLLKNVERDNLQDADELAKQIKEQNAEKQQSFDRDAQEIQQQNDLADAAHKAGEGKVQQQVKEEVEEAATIKADKQYQQARIKILTASKNDWSDLNTKQHNERTNLEKKLRQIDSQKEKHHRELWQEIINKDEQYKAQLETDLNKAGYAGIWFRFRHGKETRAEIAALDKNLENARLRLDEGVGGLTGQDRYQLMQLNKVHNEQRDDLRNRIDKALKLAGKQAREETNNKRIQEAAASPENAERLQHAVTAKTNAQKAELSRVNAKAETHKKQKVHETDKAEQHSKQIEEKPMAKKRPGMRSQDDWELDGLYSIAENEQTKNPRRNEVRREPPSPSAKHDFYKSGKQQDEDIEQTQFRDLNLQEKARAQSEALRGDYGEELQQLAGRDGLSVEDRKAFYEKYGENHAKELQQSVEMEQSQDVGQDHSQEQDQGLER